MKIVYEKSLLSSNNASKMSENWCEAWENSLTGTGAHTCSQKEGEFVIKLEKKR